MNRQRLLTILLLIVVIPMGFYTSYYSGPAEGWIRNSMGGFVYEIFWCLLVALIVPAARPFNVALGVFMATCLLEVLQLWHPPFLEVLRSNYLGRLVLGNSFNWMDFPYYLLGSLAGWAMLMLVRRAAAFRHHTSDQP